MENLIKYLKTQRLILHITIITIALVFFINLKFHEKKDPTGWIIFRTLPRTEFAESYPRNYSYYIMDGDGNQIQWIWNYRGVPAWSSDGKYIAVSCEEDVNKICILDVSTIPDWDKSIDSGENWKIPPKIVRQIDLPAACEGLVSQEFGLESISWSADSRKIAVVCGDSDYAFVRVEAGPTERLICILPIDESDQICWTDFDMSVHQVSWSPIEDRLLISIRNPENKIYLGDERGKNIDFLANGTSANWSPDGMQIAFMTEIEEGEFKGSGIAVVDDDGTNFRWLYRNIESNMFKLATGCFWGCKLSWSPDGNYIAFQAEPIDGRFKLYRLDVKSGELICLSCFDMRNPGLAPDWGLPIEW